jgi:RNA polymerase sigma-70 factor (ECF subfamily)
MAASDDTEAQIREHLTRGDHPRAVTIALERFGPEILGFLVATERNHDAGAEIFAQLCEDLWRGIGAFRGDSSFRTWAYVLARHAAVRYHRDPYQRRAAPLGDAPWLWELEDRLRTTTLSHLKSEVRDAVARLRDQLTPDEQALLILRVDRGMAWNDIAQVLDGGDREQARRHAAAHRKRYERVKNKLRELAEREGLIQRGA